MTGNVLYFPFRVVSPLGKRFDDRVRLVAFASGALLNGLREDRLDFAQVPCLNLG
jgi:hypothetical protein